MSDRSYVDELADVLASGETSIGLAAHALHWPAQRVYAVAINAPERFSIIGLDGPMRSFCVALAGDRPIQLIMPKEFRVNDQ